MPQVQIHPDAMWFGLELQGIDGEWLRVDEENLGGKWWRVGTTTPEAMAQRVAGDAPFTFRAIFAPKDKRRSLGHSPPFQTGAEDSDGGGPEPSPEAPPVDTAGAPPAAPAAPPARAAAPSPRKATAPRVNGGASPYVQPKIPMAFTPPPGDPDLTRFVFLHQLVQQQNDRFLTLALSMMQNAAEAERSRSSAMLESMKHHYAAQAQGQERLTAALLAAQKGSEAPVLMQQLAAAAQAQNDQLAQLAQKIEDFEEEDANAAQQLAQLSENPNNVERVFAGLTSIIGTVANTPLGDAIGDMLTRGRPPEAGAPPQAPFVPPPPQQHDPMGDFDDLGEGPPPQ